MGEIFGNIAVLSSFYLCINLFHESVFSAKLLGKWESVCVGKLTLKIFILKYLLNNPDNYTDT